MKSFAGLPAALSVLLCLASPSGVRGESITRAEVLEIARSFAELRWEGTAANARRGRDARGVLICTPSADDGAAGPPGHWVAGQANVGMPYKWGGFDSLASFAKGVKAGLAAGDLYNAEKRRLADAAVSSEAVGVDCSGFISRCWKLPKKHGTSNLPELCVRLRSPTELKPGDIMNYAGGHVLLFAGWVGGAKDLARFYEAEPYSKVRAGEYSASQLAANDFLPWRYRRIRD